MRRAALFCSGRRLRGALLGGLALAPGCRSAPAIPVAAVDASAPAATGTCASLRDGAVARRSGFAAGPRVAIGVIADPREARPETLASLRRVAELFRERQVDAVAALGGLGDDAEGIAKVVTALAAAHAPIFALPGDREPEEAFHEGLDRARADGLDVIDLQRVRVIVGDGLTIAALPGYPHHSYLVDGTCRFVAADVIALGELVDNLPKLADHPTLLLAHTPPRGDGEGAIDWVAGANLGDPSVAALVAAGRFTAGAFAHFDEDGGRATDGVGFGAHPVAERAWATRLFVNAGSIDALPRPGHPRAEAVVVEIEGGHARFWVLP